ISGLQLFPNNEVFEINSFNFLNDTFKLYEGIALLTDENQGTIAISEINAFESNNFYYIIENEDVTVLYFCTQLPTPKIFISNNEFYVEQKGAIDNNIKFEANLIEDGNFSIEIYSLDGKLLKKIDQELKHGLYSFDINLQSMSSGVYILKVVSLSQTKYIKFLKI
ncbi:MAG: T9SS type A sorting domain-containing protein, partial [Chloroherpetonaceae bacterium]